MKRRDTLRTLAAIPLLGLTSPGEPTKDIRWWMTWAEEQTALRGSFTHRVPQGQLDALCLELLEQMQKSQLAFSASDIQDPSHFTIVCLGGNLRLQAT